MKKKILVIEKKDKLELKPSRNLESIDGAHLLLSALVHIVKKYDLAKNKKDFVRIVGKYYDESE